MEKKSIWIVKNLRVKYFQDKYSGTFKCYFRDSRNKFKQLHYVLRPKI